MVAVAQLWDSTQKTIELHFKWMNCVVCKLYPNKMLKKITERGKSKDSNMMPLLTKVNLKLDSS